MPDCAIVDSAQKSKSESSSGRYKIKAVVREGNQGKMGSITKNSGNSMMSEISSENPKLRKTNLLFITRKIMTGKFRQVLLLICFWAAGIALIPLSAAAQSGGAFRLHVDVDLTTVEVSVMDKDENLPSGILKRTIFAFMKRGSCKKFIARMK